MWTVEWAGPEGWQPGNRRVFPSGTEAVEFIVEGGAGGHTLMDLGTLVVIDSDTCREIGVVTGRRVA